MTLGKNQQWLLKEALRRYTRFHQGEPLTSAHTWTGLGSETQYAPVADAGYMEIATTRNPGYSTWWKLTEKGAAIVQQWLDEGITHETIEAEE